VGINVLKFNYYAGSKEYQLTILQAPALRVTQHFTIFSNCFILPYSRI